MQATQGLVMKITDRFVVVVCDDGKFRNLPLTDKIPGLGERITVPLYRKKRLFSFSRVSAAAACLVLLAGLAFWFQATPRYDQIVAIDINPSLELFIDSKERVIKAKPLNPDAEKVLDHFPVGKISLQDAIAEILAKSAALGYIHKDKENIIMIAAAKSKGGSAIHSDSIEAEVKNILQSLHVNGYVKVQQTEESVYDQSKTKNLSLNKWLLLQDADRLGVPISLEKAAAESVLQLLLEAGIGKEQFFAPSRVPNGQVANQQMKAEPLSGQNSVNQDRDRSHSPNPANKENSQQQPSQTQMQMQPQPQTQTQSPTPMPSRNPNFHSPQAQTVDAGSSGRPETSGGTGPGTFGPSSAPEPSESPVLPGSSRGPDAANTSDGAKSPGAPTAPRAPEPSSSTNAPAAPAPSGGADSFGTPNAAFPPPQDSRPSEAAPSTGTDRPPGGSSQPSSSGGTPKSPDAAPPAPSNTNRR